MLPLTAARAGGASQRLPAVGCIILSFLGPLCHSASCGPFLGTDARLRAAARRLRPRKKVLGKVLGNFLGKALGKVLGKVLGSCRPGPGPSAAN